MKWFETKEIKNKEDLSLEQIEYIRKPSFTVFGPFNVLVRKHWDLIVANISINLVSKIISETNYFLPRLLILAVYFWLIYFGIVHGRRLAWNRNGWKDFKHFERSESIWMPWGVITFALLVLIILKSFIET